MYTSVQATLSSSGGTGSQAGPRNHAPHEPALQLERISQEQSISIQIRKLAVRSFTDVSEPRIDEVPGDTRALSRDSWSSVRCDPISLERNIHLNGR